MAKMENKAVKCQADFHIVVNSSAAKIIIAVVSRLERFVKKANFI